MSMREIATTPRKKPCNCGGSALRTTAPVAPPPGMRVFDVFDLGGTIEENCLRFGELLGIGGPAPVAALEAAVDDPTYLHQLMAARSAPPFLQRLLERPPAPRPRAKKQSTAKLLTRASKALMHWGASGFAMADDATVARRLDACLNCPKLTDPPKSAAYKVAGAGTASAVTGSKICSECGCVVARKARLASEACPLGLWETNS